MSRLIRVSMIAGCALALAAGTARAQDPCGGGDDEWTEEGGGGDACGGDTYGGDACGGDACGGDEGGGDAAAAGDEGGGGEAGGGHMGLVLPKGKIAIHVDLEVNLSADAVGKPFSLAPDIWYGVNEKLTAGLVHSALGATGFLGGVGSGLCLAGTDNGCAEVYDNVGAEGIYLLKSDASMSLAANGGIHVLSLSDPMFLDLKLGVVGQYHTGKIGISFAPNLFLGLTERDAGNKEMLNIPVGAMYAVDAKLGVGVQTGIAGMLDGFGDTYRIPLSLGAHYMVNDKIGVGGAFTFVNIAGKGSTADARALNLIVGYLM